MSKYNVISSGSRGNCIIYHNSIAVDIGVGFNQIEPYLYDLQIILLTHEHLDHINLSTLKKICDERPTIRIGCCDWMLPMVDKIKHPDVYEIGSKYDYGAFQIIPFKLYHDVPNCGYRIIKNDYKIIHATDTHTMEGIEAKQYDLYSIEFNYDEEIIQKQINYKSSNGKYSHEIRVVDTHLSYEQASEFIRKNKKADSEVLRLHKSESNL